VWQARQGQIHLPGLANKPKAVYLLADAAKKPLTAIHDRTGLTIKLPRDLPDEAVSIITVEIDGEPVVDTAVRRRTEGTDTAGSQFSRSLTDR